MSTVWLNNINPNFKNEDFKIIEKMRKRDCYIKIKSV